MDTATRILNTTPSKQAGKLHIRENSRDELDALFDPKRRMNSKPLSQRNLPDSFFRPPEFGTKTPSHSRQGSIDQTVTTNVLSAAVHRKPMSLMSNQVGNHLRSISEPVHMSNAFTSPNPNLVNASNNSQIGTGNVHQRQFSVCNELPLPHGWEVTKTSYGQRYFINHITKETSWQDPRTLSLPEENLENILKMMPLPTGWEKAQTNTGEVYFINHNTKTTCWEDPRLPMIPNIIKQFEQQNNMHNQQVQTMQAQNRTTPPVHYRRPNELIDNQHRVSSTININSKSFSQSNNKNQQPVPLNNEKHRLQMLLVDIIEKKNDLIKQLQEIEKQETYLKTQLNLNDVKEVLVLDYLSSSSSSNPSPLNPTVNLSQTSHGVQKTSCLPISNQHQHIRQSSADSGLGGMSHHPPQYANNIEVDVEPVNELCKLNLNQSIILQQLAYHNHMNQNSISAHQADSMDTTDSDSMEATFLKENEIDFDKILCTHHHMPDKFDVNSSITWI